MFAGISCVVFAIHHNYIPLHSTNTYGSLEFVFELLLLSLTPHMETTLTILLCEHISESCDRFSTIALSLKMVHFCWHLSLTNISLS